MVKRKQSLTQLKYRMRSFNLNGEKLRSSLGNNNLGNSVRGVSVLKPKDVRVVRVCDLTFLYNLSRLTQGVLEMLDPAVNSRVTGVSV